MSLGIKFGGGSETVIRTMEPEVVTPEQIKIIMAKFNTPGEKPITEEEAKNYLILKRREIALSQEEDEQKIVDLNK